MIRPAGAPRERIGTAELRAALEEALGRRPGARRRIADLERRPSTHSTSYAIEELGVRFEGGASLRLLFKDLSRHALLEDARRVKPAFLYDPMREIETYRSILEPDLLGTAACYGAFIDHPRARYGLFLEKVAGAELYQVGEFAIWQRVARWLAAMHARFAGESEALGRAAPLLRHDGGFYRLWPRRARAFLRRAEPPPPGADRRAMERLVGNYDRVVERLAALPTTLVHGEFYASNVLVHGTGGDLSDLRVCAVDWEMAAVGAGPIDLAALTAGGWNAGEREALALDYHAALTPRLDWPPAPEEFLTALDYCRLHLAMQWLGWSPGWTPPPEHAQDWLGEALGLAERLGLV